MPNINSNTIQFHIAAFSKEENIFKYLILHRSNNQRIYPNIWQVITGTIEENETALDCAIREVREEIGIVIPMENVFTVPYISNYFIPNIDTISLSPVFATIIDINSTIILSQEHQAYNWVSAEEFESTIILPAHKEANKIFFQTILISSNPSLFRYKK